MDEREAVAAVVQMYIDGCAQADAGLVGEAFVESARMYGNDGADHYDVPIGEFLEDVADMPVPGPGYRANIERIDVFGDGAFATLVEADYQGVDYVNLFSLVKIDDRWRIVTKVFVVTGGSPPPETG